MIEHYVQWGLSRAAIEYVPNGQDQTPLKPPHEPALSKRNRFGFFGQLVDNKGVHVLLEAVSILRSSGFTDFSVEINGDNIRYASETRRAAFEDFMTRERALPIGEQLVVLNGSYHPDQVGARMGRVDWCVVPSTWWEAFCLVISEAWIHGKPVIASDVGGPAERIRREVDGLLFPLGDARAMAETMRRAATDPALWRKLVAGISAPPTRDVMVQGYIAAYQST